MRWQMKCQMLPWWICLTMRISIRTSWKMPAKTSLLTCKTWAKTRAQPSAAMACVNSTWARTAPSAPRIVATVPWGAAMESAFWR
jgi:hypothetical protein